MTRSLPRPFSAITPRHLKCMAIFAAFLLVQNMLAATLDGAIETLDSYTARFAVTVLTLMLALPHVLSATLAPEGPNRDTQRLLRNFFLMAAIAGLIALAITPMMPGATTSPA